MDGLGMDTGVASDMAVADSLPPASLSQLLTSLDTESALNDGRIKENSLDTSTDPFRIRSHYQDRQFYVVVNIRYSECRPESHLFSMNIGLQITRDKNFINATTITLYRFYLLSYPLS